MKPVYLSLTVAWWIYIVECVDGTLYTGITKGEGSWAVDRRVKKHNSGQGAKYTRSRCPVHCVWYDRVGTTKSEALKREYAIKQMTRPEKQRLIAA